MNVKAWIAGIALVGLFACGFWWAIKIAGGFT